MDAFGGKVDFTPNSTMNVLVKKVMKRNMLKDNPDLDEIEPKVYDFRDWDQVNHFANSWKEIVSQ